MMKTKILSFMFLMGIVLIGTNAFAQNNQTPNLGDEETYTITPSSTLGTWTTSPSYAWSIDDATAIQGGAATLSGSSVSKTVTWIKSGSFTITVIGTDDNGCLTEPATISVNVSAMEACINSGGVTNSSICSLLTSTATGEADDDATIAFPITVSNSTSGKTYTINYTLTAGSDSYIGQETGYTPGEDITVDINADSNRIALFSNPTDGNKTVTLTITSVTQEGTSLSVSLCADPTFEYTVYEKPSISFQ